MRRFVTRAAGALAFPTIALILVAIFAPGRLEPAAQIYGLVVAAIALLAVLTALHHEYPPPRRSLVDEALEQPEREEEPLSELARLEREVTLGVASTYDLHFRLRPTLRDTAAGLLAVRRGIDLDRQPERARAALGDDTWQLVRPDVEPPADRLARGIEPDRVRRIVEALERL